jgi:23S rRNA pseudouridine2605 synthase
MRLNAYLARAGVASRRTADDLIKSGQVLVNGQPGQLNTVVEPGDTVVLNGKKLGPQGTLFILLNKPAGTVTTLKDPHGRKTVMDCVNIGTRVFPVGRLDYDTTGALILTNDGDAAHKLMHPSFLIDKVYEAKVKGNITPEILNKLSNGVEVDGRLSAPAVVKKLNDNKVELTIHEGRNHQVKKMLAAVGLETISLHRSKYAGLSLTNLEPGKWRYLKPDEQKTLASDKISPNDRSR